MNKTIDLQKDLNEAEMRTMLGIYFRREQANQALSQLAQQQQALIDSVAARLAAPPILTPDRAAELRAELAAKQEAAKPQDQE